MDVKGSPTLSRLPIETNSWSHDFELVTGRARSNAGWTFSDTIAPVHSNNFDLGPHLQPKLQQR
jgi:hypothetical protein